ncbi:MAG TPA: two-component regulator propeller domain-containing protein [Chitinophagales bacterium]|nr:two-component regulator propeller domain-containing protein [Chitinophagales bacterium]
MKKLLPLLLLLAAITVSAQDDLVFTRYSHADGLPASFSNTTLRMDESGYLWIYNEQGFARYDGYSVKLFPFSDASIWGKTIPTGYYVDIGGFERFYISPRLSVYVYNPLKNGFDLYDFSKFVDGNKEQTLFVRDDRRNHCLWVFSKSKLFKLSYFSGSIKQFDAPFTSRIRYVLPGNKIIYATQNDTIIVFDIEKEIFKSMYFKGGKDLGYHNSEQYINAGGTNEMVSKVIVSTDGKKIFWFTRQAPLSPKIIGSDKLIAKFYISASPIALTDSNTLWANSGNGYLTRYDFNKGKIDSVDINLPGKPSDNLGTTSIVEDADNELWLSFIVNGLMRINPDTKKVTQYLTVPGNPNSLWVNNISGLQYHNSGVLWVNQPSFGLVKIEKKKNVFKTIIPLPDALSPLRPYFDALNTRMLLPLDSDHVLAGTFAAISNVNIRTGKVDLMRYPDNTVVQELSISRTYGCAAKDKEGNIFIGTWNKWFFIYRAREKKCSVYRGLPEPFPKESQLWFRTMLVDSRNMLWIGSGEGLFRVSVNDLLTDSTPEIEDMNPGDSTSLKTVFTIIEDRNKNVWVGSLNGIKVFSPDGKVTSYVHEEGKNSLSINEVRCLAEDNDGNIWIATSGGGLNKLDIATHQFTVYRTKDGLADDVLYAIIIDKENNVWVSSNLGLTKFNPSDRTVNNFTPFDGLQGYEFNTNAFCTMPGGELVFGGTTGMSWFKPENIGVSAPAPVVVLSSFQVLGEETRLDSGVTHLNYSQDNLTFQFAAISYFRNAGNKFAYKLEGLDKDWVYSGNRPYVTYSHVPPGNYTFRVKAANSSGVWNQKGIAYKISVSPPWWATWWFRIAAVIALASAIYVLYRYQLRQALKLQMIRNRIAGDLHDEIGSTLSSISIYSQVAKKEVMNNPVHAASMLESITDNTTGMMDAMNDIVWMINTRNDGFNNIVDRMNAFANELLEAKNCNVHLHITPELQKLRLDMTQRKNLYLIFKEAINNAAKYADCRNVWIDLSMNGSHKIMMSIKDDGKGFNMNGESKGNGLPNMQKRAMELNGELKISSRAGEGTSLNLEFAL